MSSVAEIEAAIKNLAPNDLNKIVERIALLQAELDEAGKPAKKDFDEAMNKVFDHHAPLL